MYTQEGNLAFKLGGLEDACASYERALDLLDFHLSPGDLQEEVISEQRKCYLNLAAVGHPATRPLRPKSWG